MPNNPEAAPSLPKGADASMASGGEPLNREDFIHAIILFAATLVAQLANQWYLAIEKQQSISQFLLPSLIFLTALTLPSIWLGFKLGKPMGLGLLNRNLCSSKTTAKPSSGVLFAILAGLALGIVLLGVRWFLGPYLPPEAPEYGFRGPIGGLLVSIGAAVGEEVWFRFGMMTLILFVVCKITRVERVSDRVALITIVVVALAFGLAHLPQLISYGAGTTFAIVGTILGNVAVGTLYGWCFWRYGLFSAILAHFILDVVLHVLTALF